MNSFVNGYRCSIKNDGSEFILKLTQTFPTYDETGNLSISRTEEVGSFVMTPQNAKAVADAIYNVLQSKPSSEQ